MTFKAEKAKQLAEEFPRVLVKKNPQGMDYVPVAEVVARMNRVIGAGDWRVEILKTDVWGAQETAFGPCPVHVVATVRVHVKGDDGEWTWTDGMGGQDVGFYKDKAKGPLNLGDSYKGACSDAMKKALQHMGVALELSRNDEAIRYEQQLEAQQAAKNLTESQQAVKDEVAELETKDKAKHTKLAEWWAAQKLPRTHQLSDAQCDEVLAQIEFLVANVTLPAEAAK